MKTPNGPPTVPERRNWISSALITSTEIPALGPSANVAMRAGTSLGSYLRNGGKGGIGESGGLGLCPGSPAAVSTAAGRGLFRPIGTELPPVGNRITTVRSLQSPVSSLSWTADCMLPTAYWPSAHPAPKVVLCGCQQ